MQQTPPSPLVDRFEAQRQAWNAGDIEASLMLHFRPDLVDMSKAKMFPSRAADIEKQFTARIGQRGVRWREEWFRPKKSDRVMLRLAGCYPSLAHDYLRCYMFTDEIDARWAMEMASQWSETV